VYDPVATAFMAAKIDKHSWEMCMPLHVMHTVTYKSYMVLLYFHSHWLTALQMKRPRI